MASSNVVGSYTASELGENTTRPRGASLISNRSHRSQRSQRSNRQGSIMNPPETTNNYGDNVEGVQSPAQSQSSANAAGIPYDALSVTSKKSGITSDSPVTAITSVSQQPELQAHPSTHSTSTASTLGSSSKRGSVASKQKPYFDVAKAIFYQADSDHDGLITREEFRQWAEPGIVYPEGSQQRRSRSLISAGRTGSRSQSLSGQLPPRVPTPGGQLPSRTQTPAQQSVLNDAGVNVLNETNTNALNEAPVDIDYGAVEAYNTAMRSSVDINAEDAQGSIFGGGPNGSVTGGNGTAGGSVSGAPRASFSGSARGSFSGAPQGSTTGYNRCSTSGEPRPSFSGQPRASVSGENRASFSGQARTSFSGEPRTSFSGQPRTSVSGEPRASFSGEPQTGYGGETRTSFSAQPRTSFSGQPRTSVSGEPRASFSGEPRASFSGQPRTSFSGENRTSFSAIPRASVSGEPRVSVSGEPRVSVSGAPRASYSGGAGYNGGVRTSVSGTAIGSAARRFDVAKAIFNQADANHDGVISREEFRQWATPGLLPPSGRTHSGYETGSNHRASVGNGSGYRNSIGQGSAHRSSIRAGSVPRNSVGNGSGYRNSIGNAAAAQRNSVGNLSTHRDSVGNTFPPRGSFGNASNLGQQFVDDNLNGADDIGESASNFG